jgi:ABC-type glutathione transport system ATPase component
MKLQCVVQLTDTCHMQVLLLDELTTFLDVEDANSVLQAVRELVSASDDVAAVWVTHRLEELKFADTVTCMDKGTVQLSGSPDKILNHLQMLGATV